MWPFGRMVMCHMVADTQEELDAMADKISVARKWRQGAKRDRGVGSLIHYDIAKSKRVLAVNAGAVALDTLEAEVDVLDRLANNRNGLTGRKHGLQRT
jgi:hypothetical protein